MVDGLIQEPLNTLEQEDHMISDATLSKLANHFILLKNLFLWHLCIFLILGLPIQCLAQELEPRRWSHLPTGKSFIGGGYVYTKGDIYFDPVLQLLHVVHTARVPCQVQIRQPDELHLVKCLSLGLRLVELHQHRIPLPLLGIWRGDIALFLLWRGWRRLLGT